jgi:hypothetical protein
LEDKDFKSGLHAISRLIREVGNIISGKDTKCEEPPPILSSLREVSLHNPHSKIASLNYIISWITSDVRLAKKHTSGKDTMIGHSHISNF